MNCFSVVSQFEEAVAKFAGSRFAVAVNTGTSALFLSMKYKGSSGQVVRMPKRTFVSVPMAALHAGLKVEFTDEEWSGTYTIDPLNVVDGALRFRKGMYQGGLHCLSFQARKILNIGEGGMILTNDFEAVQWLRKARYWGRPESGKIEDIDMVGWQMYMTPEKAGRGLHLLEYIRPDSPDQVMVYPDLRSVKVFND